MKSRMLVIVSLVASFTGSAVAQSGTSGYPFDTPADPRSVAMGESFVGLPSNPAALMYNPAGLAGLTGMNISYSRKNLDWFIRDWSIWSVNATVGTSFGVFAAQYNRKSMGTIPVTTEQYPDGNGSEITLYSHDVAFGYAYRLPVGLAIGASAKYYDLVETLSGPLNSGIGTWKSTPAYLFDFGLTYTLPRLHSQDAVEDSITVGLSYQNIGSRWEYEYTPSPDQHVLVGNYRGPVFYQMPEYFRVGLSYALRVRPAEEQALTPFSALLSGEFRSLQAPLQSTAYLMYYGPIPPVPETSYWGIGVEFTIYEFFSVRGGATFRPYTDVEGERDRASFRYGAGLHIPFRRIGLDVPLTVSFQYTVIPVSEPTSSYVFIEDTGVNKGTYPLFSLEIQYTGFPW
jgi:hypothetical protein